VIAFAALLAGGLVPSLFGFSLIEHRWWYIAQIFGALPLAALLASVHPVSGRVAVIVLCGALSFLMITGMPANMDNTTFSKNHLVRYAITHDEEQALRYTMTNYDGTVGMDAYYTLASHLMPKYRERMTNITAEILSGDYSDTACDLILIRDEVSSGVFAFGEGKIYKLLYDTNDRLIDEGYELLYCFDSVRGYGKVEQVKQ